MNYKNNHSKIGKETPFHILSKIFHHSNHLKIFKIIFENGWGLNSKDSLGKTPIHCAVENDQENFWKTLKNSTTTEIQNCWDLESKDNNGKTPLHYAVKNCNSKFVNILLSHVQDKESQG